MSEKIQRIRALLGQYHIILKCRNRKDQLVKELAEKKKTLQGLSRRVEAEYRDIEKIQDRPFSKLFGGVLATRQQALDKERQEYLLALIEYKEFKAVVELIEYEVDLLQKQLDKNAGEHLAADLERQLFALTEEELLTQSIHLDRYKSILQDLKNLFYLQVEIQEAMLVVEKLQEEFAALVSILKVAQGLDSWGYNYAEKQRAKERKKLYIDKSQAKIYVIRKHAIILQDELADVSEYQQLFKRSEAYIAGFNIQYYKDLLVDWLDNESYDVTISHTVIVQQAAKDLAAELLQLSKKVAKELQYLEQKREEVIIDVVNDVNKPD